MNLAAATLSKPSGNSKMTHQQFVTTNRGLQRQSPPMRLFEKAKRF